MGAVWLVFGSEFRRRWRSWLVLAVLIAVVGGLVLAAAAAGRRTATAFPRFVVAHGYDFYVYNNQPVPGWHVCPESPPSQRSADPPAETDVRTVPTQSTRRPLHQRAAAHGLQAGGEAGRRPDAVPFLPGRGAGVVQPPTGYGVHIGTVIHTPLY